MKEKYYDQYRKIGLKISYYRKLKGMTQEQLAEKIDKNLAFIGLWQIGNGVFRLQAQWAFWVDCACDFICLFGVYVNRTSLHLDYTCIRTHLSLDTLFDIATALNVQPYKFLVDDE